jgi:hypothetical protein
MENYRFTFKVQMELIIIKFLFLDKRCYLPQILNSSNIFKRGKENELIKLIVENLEKTNGVTNVQVIPGGIASKEELSEVIQSFMTENENQEIKYLDFYKREFNDVTNDNYPHFVNVKYKGFLSLPVKVINDENDLLEFGSLPLPIILIE